MPPCTYGHVQFWLPPSSPLLPSPASLLLGRRRRFSARRLVADERRLGRRGCSVTGQGMATTARWATRLPSTIRTRPGNRGVFAGSALRFDGNDLVRIPDSDELSIRPNDDGGGVDPRRDASPGQFNRYVLAKGVNWRATAASYGLYSGRATAAWPSTSATARRRVVRSPEAPTYDLGRKWHHAAGTFDGSDRAPLHRRRRRSAHGTSASTAITYNPPERRRRHRRLGRKRHTATCSSSATSTACRSGRARFRWLTSGAS